MICKSSNSQVQVKSKSAWLCIESSQVRVGYLKKTSQIQVHHILEYSSQVQVKSIFNKTRTVKCRDLHIIDQHSSVSRDNFIQLDLFYKELSYEKIEQHEAFQFLSLLSEVGGFLGKYLSINIAGCNNNLDEFS